MTSALLYEPGSPEWLGLITPSKVAAILGVSRWESQFSLWYRMKGLIPPEPPKDIFRTGHAMELALAYLWREENPGWQLSRGPVQVVHDRFGFPCAATPDRRARRGSGCKRIIEFKTARKLEEWGDFFTDDAPADYLVQVQALMLFTGWAEFPAHLVVMGPWLEHHTYVIPFDAELGDHIIQKCREWQASLDEGIPPPLDDRVETYEAVRQLHPDVDGSSVQLDPRLARSYLQADADMKTAATRLTGLKTQVLAAMGSAQTALCGRVKVADRRPNSHGTVSLYAAKTANPDELPEPPERDIGDAA